MIAVLYSPKYNEIVLVYKSPERDADDLSIMCSNEFGHIWRRFSQENHPCILLKDTDDWVFLGDL